MIKKIITSVLLLMATMIIWNVTMEYIVPEIQSGEISFKPKGWKR